MSVVSCARYCVCNSFSAKSSVLLKINIFTEEVVFRLNITCKTILILSLKTFKNFLSVSIKTFEKGKKKFSRRS